MFWCELFFELVMWLGGLLIELVDWVVSSIMGSRRREGVVSEDDRPRNTALVGTIGVVLLLAVIAGVVILGVRLARLYGTAMDP